MANSNLISIAIPNLIAGVSQQPAALRTSTSMQAMVNAWPSVVTGLNKRPATEHIAKLGITPVGSMTGHVIDRSTGYRYIVVIFDGQLKVYDMDGNEQTVSMPNGNAYLGQANNAVEAFRFLTFQDTTFILNRDVTVLINNYGEDVAGSYTPDGSAATVSSFPPANLSMKGKVYQETNTGTYYRCTEHVASPEVRSWVYISTSMYPYTSVPTPNATKLPSTTGNREVGSLFYVYTGPANSDNTYQNYAKYEVQITQAASGITYSWDAVKLIDIIGDSPDRLNPQSRGTVYVTNSIANSYYSVYINNALVGTYLTPKGVDATSSVPGTSTIAESLSTSLTSNGISNTVEGSTVCITGLQPTDTLKVTTTNGDKAMKCYRDSIASFSDLPPREKNGRIVMVQGDVKNNGDDYYVIHKDGLWIETYGYADGSRLRADTMPHVLVRNEDGTWTFKQHVWESRNAGSSESNPGPSFANDQLSDMFLYTNRMGFLSTSNVVLSESNVFENFYRTTMATLVDSDPLDFSVLSAMDDYLRHAVPFNKDILILADRSQHRFTYNNFVGPKNVQVQFTTSFNVAQNVKPINMGNSVYFVDDKPGYAYAKIFEYFPRPNMTGDDADETTAPIPQYIKSGVRFIGGSPRISAMIAGSDASPSSLFFHKYFWAGEKKVQNSWHTWSFPDCTKVHWATFSQNYLYVFMSRPDGVSLERIRVDEDLFNQDTGSAIMLDRRLTKSQITVSYVDDTTTITLPYTTTGSPLVCVDLGNGREALDTTKVSSNTVTVNGDITGATSVWVGIEYEFMAEFSTPYVRVQKGQGEIIDLDSRLQMRYLTLEYHNTPHFQTKITLPGRAEHVQTFDKPTGSGRHRIPVLGENTKFSLKITNDGPFNCSFGSGDWQAIYTRKARKT